LPAQERRSRIEWHVVDRRRSGSSTDQQSERARDGPLKIRAEPNAKATVSIEVRIRRGLVRLIERRGVPDSVIRRCQLLLAAKKGAPAPVTGQQVGGVEKDGEVSPALGGEKNLRLDEIRVRLGAAVPVIV